MRALSRIAHVLALVVLVPTVSFAQATITGTVKDTSGAVLPGVTVEAASPALIEKVRAAVTDGNGIYRIVDLRPGTYSVTFTLPGFNTTKRDGVELTGSFTASVDGELRVGSLEETITVTGETPIVDVQSVRRQVTVSNELISSMPAARSYAGIMMLIPATTTRRAATSISRSRPACSCSAAPAVATTKRAFRLTASTRAPRSTAAAFRAIRQTSPTRRKSP
jgi:hypothetical protein